MATKLEFIQFVCEQIDSPYSVTYKKMFGEYMVYVNEKPILLVCDNTVYVKKVEQVKELLQDTECGVPYNGAKEHYILDIEDRFLTSEVVSILEKTTPHKQKKIKKDKQN